NLQNYTTRAPRSTAKVVHARRNASFASCSAKSRPNLLPCCPNRTICLLTQADGAGTPMIVLALLAGGAIGAALGAYVSRTTARDRCRREVAEIAAKSAADIASTSARLDEWSKRIAALDQDLRTSNTLLERAESEGATLREERTRLATELDGERRAAAEKLALLQQTEVRLREAFDALSAEALRKNNKSFLELAKTSLG